MWKSVWEAGFHTFPPKLDQLVLSLLQNWTRLTFFKYAEVTQELPVEMLTSLVTSEIPSKPIWNYLAWLDTVNIEFELIFISERL